MYDLPVILHVDHNPATLSGLVETSVEAAHVRVAVVGPFALVVRVVDDHSKARSLASCGPLQHLKVTIGIAEGRDGAQTDELVNTNRLSRPVVDEVDLR